MMVDAWRTPSRNTGLRHGIDLVRKPMLKLGPFAHVDTTAWLHPTSGRGAPHPSSHRVTEPRSFSTIAGPCHQRAMCSPPRLASAHWLIQVDPPGSALSDPFFAQLQRTIQGILGRFRRREPWNWCLKLRQQMRRSEAYVCWF